MPTLKRQTGDVGEKIAVDYLKNNSYKIIDKNYLKPWGEIDIIAKKDEALVFIEVKTYNYPYRLAEENVHYYKQRKLIRTAETYLLEKNYPVETIWQIDIISIELNNQTKQANLKHFKNAVLG